MKALDERRGSEAGPRPAARPEGPALPGLREGGLSPCRAGWLGASAQGRLTETSSSGRRAGFGTSAG